MAHREGLVCTLIRGKIVFNQSKINGTVIPVKAADKSSG